MLPPLTGWPTSFARAESRDHGHLWLVAFDCGCEAYVFADVRTMTPPHRMPCRKHDDLDVPRETARRRPYVETFDAEGRSSRGRVARGGP